MTLSQRLQACAVRIRQGWCQHVLFTDEGGVCALGAMIVVDQQAGLIGDLEPVLPDILVALRRAVGTQQIVAWNNAPDQTAENVALAFELAALMEAPRCPVPGGSPGTIDASVGPTMSSGTAS